MFGLPPQRQFQPIDYGAELAGLNRGLLTTADTLVGNPLAGLLNTTMSSDIQRGPILRYAQDLGIGQGQGGFGQLVGEMGSEMLPVAGDIAGAKKDWDAWHAGNLPGWAVPLAIAGLLPLVPPAARYIGRALPDMAGTPTAFGRDQRGMITWHGSPHQFAPTEANPLGEFDLAHMGTGEGAQVYGHGTYLAEAQDVGGRYRDILSTQPDPVLGNIPRYIEYKGRGIDLRTPVQNMPPEDLALVHVALNDGSPSRAIEGLASDAEFPGMPDAEKYQQASEWLADRLAKKDPDIFVQARPGSLYKVDLPDEQIAKMLDHDAPLRDQPEAMRIFSEMFEGNDLIDLKPDAPGGRAYEDAAWILGERAGIDDGVRPDYLVSEYLAEQGIPGLKFFDGNSRAAGEGTRNFVLFDPSIANILERNGQTAEQLGLLSP